MWFFMKYQIIQTQIDWEDMSYGENIVDFEVEKFYEKIIIILSSGINRVLFRLLIRM